MPIDITYEPKTIELEIPDINIDDTIIKRKAFLISLEYHNQGKFVLLNWKIKHYANNNGTYGNLLEFIADRGMVLTADDSTMVNSQTGAFVYPDINGDYPNVPYCGQYTFFNKLAEFQPLIIHNLIKQYGQQANWSA